MINQNKFQGTLLRKIEAAHPRDYEILKTQVMKMLLGAKINLYSRLTREDLAGRLCFTEEETMQFCDQFLEKLRRHATNVFEQLELRRK